jgi:integrase
MRSVNPDNERLKRRYFTHLREAEGLQPVTIDHASRAIADFEEFTRWRDFKKFRPTDAASYRKKLFEGPGKLAAQNRRSTVQTKLRLVQKFFRWLNGQAGFRKAIRLTDLDYFNLSARDRRVAAAPRERTAASVEQVQHVIRSMPSATDIELRNRALVACFLLTGSRIKALVSLKFKHVRADRLGIDFDGAEVETKFGKSFTAYFLPVGKDIRSILLDYLQHLQTKLLWGPDDPLFPATLQGVREAHKFETIGLDRRHWSCPGAARKIYKSAFEKAGIPYHSPHSIRTTLTHWAERNCQDFEQIKVVSQILAHEDLLTTFRSYGHVPPRRLAQVIADMWDREDGRGANNMDELFAKFREIMKNGNMV